MTVITAPGFTGYSVFRLSRDKIIYIIQMLKMQKYWPQSLFISCIKAFSNFTHLQQIEVAQMSWKGRVKISPNGLLISDGFNQALYNNLWKWTCIAYFFMAICERTVTWRKKWDLPISLSCLYKSVEISYKLFNAAALWISKWRTNVGFLTMHNFRPYGALCDYLCRFTCINLFFFVGHMQAKSRAWPC